MSNNQKDARREYKLSDGRTVYRRLIGGTLYEYRDAIADEISDVENEALKPYLLHFRENPDAIIPQYERDRRYVHLVASVLSPKLTCTDISKMPGKHYLALRNTVFKDLKLDQQDDVKFPDGVDVQSVRNTDGKLPTVHSEGPKKSLDERFILTVENGSLAKPTNRVSPP